ncbi:methylmalonyl-CoA mutase family protein [Bacillus sp. 1P06AnD]|uniref:methylmalonyl-CoA mutase family protein n=1 Tax=Bacillus sp. 1P06AnD TaxID=3132208 RepID=UPI0039A1C6FE
MNVLQTKEILFSKATKQDWEQKAALSLKGKTLENLYTPTYEGITLQPFYSGHACVKNERPGLQPYTRGIADKEYNEQPWKMIQPLKGDTWAAIKDSLKEASSRGQKTIVLTAEQFNILTVAEKEELFHFAQNKDYDFFLTKIEDAAEIFSGLQWLSSIEGIQISGSMASDPILTAASAGKPLPEKGAFANWFKSLREAAITLPNMRTVLIDTSIVHNAGGHAVQELAVGLAAASEYIHLAKQNGLDAGFIAKHSLFTFSIDSIFFTNIAKLRAARRLWACLGKDLEEDPELFKMNIHCETSLFTSAVYDPYVNILRNANQALAAVLGGAQSLEVGRYNQAAGDKNTAFSERLARNIHLLLKEETSIDKVIDPGGGSYYIEQLTSDLAEKAWELFVEIEERGGLIETLKTGWLQGQINRTWDNRVHHLEHGIDRLIGINAYADIDEKQIAMPDSDTYVKAAAESIMPLESKRLAQTFEGIRVRSSRYKERMGSLPQVGLICLGTLKSYKARADFSKETLATAGIEGIVMEYSNVESLVEVLEKSQLSNCILCGTNDQYEIEAKALVEDLAERLPKVHLYLAGNMGEDAMRQLKQAGLQGSIAKGDNIRAFTSKLLNDMGVE